MLIETKMYRFVVVWRHFIEAERHVFWVFQLETGLYILRDQRQIATTTFSAYKQASAHCLLTCQNKADERLFAQYGRTVG